jgi:Na+/proline symporter
MGLSAIALNIQLTPEEVGAGLPAAAAAAALLGRAGAVVVLILLFLAVTSSTSAELVAVSSIATCTCPINLLVELAINIRLIYVATDDIYLPYFNPNATDKQMLLVDHIAIAVYAITMAVLGVIFFYSGISMGWLYEFMGVFLGSAVVPIALSMTSRSANKWGCIAGAWIGLACGISTWLIVTGTMYGSITISTTFNDYPMLAGNLVSIGVGAIIAIGSSIIWPADFDFEITRTQAGVRFITAQDTIIVETGSETGAVEAKGEKVLDTITKVDAKESIDASSSVSLVDGELVFQFFHRFVSQADILSR